MAKRDLELHPAAASEARAIWNYYLDHDMSLEAQSFERQLTQALEAIADSPLRSPSHRRGTRRLVLNRLPYAVIYRVTDATVQIIAIAHVRRHPDYWASR